MFEQKKKKNYKKELELKMFAQKKKKE